MSTLRGTNLNPTEADNPFVGKKALEAPNRKVRQYLEDQIQRWQDFHKTQAGKDCAEIADPEIKRLESLLRLSPLEFSRALGITPEFVSEYRAQVRGEIQAWCKIKYELPRLKSQVDGLSEAGQTNRTKGWRTKREKKG